MATSMNKSSARQLAAPRWGGTEALLARWSDVLQGALSRPIAEALQSILFWKARRRVQSRAQWMQCIPMLCAFAVALGVQGAVGWHELQLGNPLLAAGWFLLAPLLSVYLLFAGLHRVLRGEGATTLRPNLEPTPWPGEPADVRARFAAAIPRARDSIP